MNLLLLKLVLSPLLLWMASLAVRRWGAAVGGLLVGLPLTSGPVSIFLALERGPDFAFNATSGSLAATTGQVAFALAYSALAGRGWMAAMSGAGVAFLAVSACLQYSGFNQSILFLIAVLAALLSLRLIPPGPAAIRPARAPWWDLPARIVIMAALVVGVTSAAGHIGPGPAGVIASFPFMAAVLGGFADHAEGAQAARLVMRGLCAGLLGFAVFFYIVSLTVQTQPYSLVYGGAILCALISQAMALRLIRAAR